MQQSDCEAYASLSFKILTPETSDNRRGGWNVSTSSTMSQKQYRKRVLQRSPRSREVAWRAFQISNGVSYHGRKSVLW